MLSLHHAVLRYSKEELLALHFTTTSPPEFPPETMVASEFALPPVSSLPFDYEDIYEQWKLNRNRGGRGRGRGTSTGNNGQNDSGQQQSSSSDRSRSNGKWDDEKSARVRVVATCLLKCVRRGGSDRCLDLYDVR